MNQALCNVLHTSITDNNTVGLRNMLPWALNYSPPISAGWSLAPTTFVLHFAPDLHTDPERCAMHAQTMSA